MFRRTRFLVQVLIAALLLAPAAAEAAGGNISVGAVTPGGDLTITADSENNDYTITQNADGTVTVTGNNGTLVDGQAAVTTPAAVTGKISTNGYGGDDVITVDGVTVAELKIKDEIGNNTIVVRRTKLTGKLDVKNSNGSIDISDSSWGSRKIRAGQGTVTPANLAGNGGAGSVGTPPSGGGGDKKATSSKKAAVKKAAEDVIEAQKQGLPTANPAQRGLVVPDLPNHPGYGGKSPAPKSKY